MLKVVSGVQCYVSPFDCPGHFLSCERRPSLRGMASAETQWAANGGTHADGWGTQQILAVSRGSPIWGCDVCTSSI